jgi:uncharacterized protein YjbI with pentapeptide repeats
VAKLEEGVEAWNHARESSPQFQPDLSKANLIDANLKEADLRGADLREANLSRCDLEEAVLSDALLSGANLREANLKGAYLRGADLRSCDITKASLGRTSFGNVDLRGIKGLGTCKHFGPSFLDYLTISRAGSLPVPFLRGCGLPDQYIEYLPSLISQAIRFYSCFISYSNKDKGFAERIWSDLQNKNVRCWFAPEDLKIGDRFQECIEDSIRIYDKLLIILSEASVSSAWVEREVQAAREREEKTCKPVLFPIRVDDAVMQTTKAWAADLRRTRHIGDFTRWKDPDSYQKAFERLLRDLKAKNPVTNKRRGPVEPCYPAARGEPKLLNF